MGKIVTVMSKLCADAHKDKNMQNAQQRLEEAAEQELLKAEEIVTRRKTLYDMLEEKQTYIDFCKMEWSTVCGDEWIAVYDSRLYVMSLESEQRVKIEDCTPTDTKRRVACSAKDEDVIFALRGYIDSMRSER